MTLSELKAHRREAFDEKFSNHGFYPGVREVHHDFLDETIDLIWKEALKFSEGTKNGVQRYQMGYEDGKREAMEAAITIVINESKPSNEIMKIVRTLRSTDSTV